MGSFDQTEVEVGRLVADDSQGRASVAASCEFCTELGSFGESRFGRLYHQEVTTRVVAENDVFVALPSIGQIAVGHTLVLPRSHVETFAELDRSDLQLALNLVEYVAEVLSCWGRSVIFEHGAKRLTSSGCGVYHAHLHVVPVQRPIAANNILYGLQTDRFPSLESALFELSGEENYAVVRGTQGDVHAASKPAGFTGDAFKSQFLRRSLSRQLGASEVLNWRDYNRVEPSVLKSICLFNNLS